MKIKILTFLCLICLINPSLLWAESARSSKSKRGAKIVLNDSEKLAMKSMKQKIKICAAGKKDQLVESCKKLVPPPVEGKKSKVTPEMKMCKKMMVKQSVIECTKVEARNLNPKLFGYWKNKFGPKFQKTVNEHDSYKKSLQQSYSTEKGWMKEFGSETTISTKHKKKSNKNN